MRILSHISFCRDMCIYNCFHAVLDDIDMSIIRWVIKHIITGLSNDGCSKKEILNAFVKWFKETCIRVNYRAINYTLIEVVIQRTHKQNA